MARQDRCVVCDYSEAEGSPALGIRPGGYGRVRMTRGEPHCESCLDAIGENLHDLSMEDEIEPVE